jgi:hypothetical protein
MTVHQIVKALMKKSREDLATAGREALLPTLIPPPLLNTEVLAFAAEQQVLRERPLAEEPPHWEIPPEPPRKNETDLVPEEVSRFLADLGEIVHSDLPAQFRDLIPRGSVGESFLRASLLSLVGNLRAGEGVAGTLGSLPLTIRVEGDGWPEALDGTALKALTPGAVFANNVNSPVQVKVVPKTEIDQNG